ncbi:proline dehydrogenase [bacterium]|nr:MAG: proline dehydrogenase [bacterium]
MLVRNLVLKTAALGPVERIVRRSRFFRPLVSRFIAGDTLDEALVATQALLDKGLMVTLDYLGENTHSEAEALQAKATYLTMLDRIAAVPAMANHGSGIEPLNISIKLTQCGLDQGEAFAETNYREVVQRAAERNTFVRIDMEASEYTQRTVEIVERVFRELPNTGTVLQSYLYRTDADVEKMIELQARVRLVKGAYLEPESVALPNKADVDDAFVKQGKRLLEAGYYPALATHDEHAIREFNAFAEQNGIDKSRFEYQMLYGIRRDLQESLKNQGYNVRVYVPFGDAWYPYFTRRLAERPANAFFIVKSLFKG